MFLSGRGRSNEPVTLSLRADHVIHISEAECPILSRSLRKGGSDAVGHKGFRTPGGRDDAGFWISAVGFAAMTDTANFDCFGIWADKEEPVIANAQS
jgi:hypothetical protein